jgi:hypothetical protein
MLFLYEQKETEMADLRNHAKNSTFTVLTSGSVRLPVGPDNLSPGATGYAVQSDIVSGIVPWQPATWPNYSVWNSSLIDVLKTIIQESLFEEIDNVIADAMATVGNLQRRGHVVAIGLMCALDSIAAYGYGRTYTSTKNRNGVENKFRVRDFIKNHFPPAYHPFANYLYERPRHDLIHKWNLFSASMTPGDDPIDSVDGVPRFGLLNFRDALKTGTLNFLSELEKNPELQRQTLQRYQELKKGS